MATAILSVPGATLRPMDTLSNPLDTEPRFLLPDAEFADVCNETARHFGLIPFRRGPKVSLWLVFESRWGGHRTGEWVPLDVSLDPDSPEELAADCDLLAEEMEDGSLPDETALLILRRPGRGRST